MKWSSTPSAAAAQAWYRWMLVLAGLFGYINAWAQAPDLSRSLPEIPEGYWLQAEVYAEHTSGALEGMTTYRVYMNCMGPLDYVSSCSGDDANPLRLLTGDAGWYNSPFNASPFAVGLNPMLYDFIPEIQYDSFLTIGAEDATTPASMHPGSVWGEIDATEEFDGDGDGADLLVDDTQGGAWYLPFPGLEMADEHPAFAGDDLRVLIAQITTAGTIEGQIQIQIFQDGLQANEFRSLMPIAFEAVAGCLDPDAMNYNENANLDDGSCNYFCGIGTRLDPVTGKCELEAWEGEVGDMTQFAACHYDLDVSGWMDVTDLYRILAVMGQEVDLPFGPCGAGTAYNAATSMCEPVASTDGVGDGLNNLNPEYFDLNGDGTLNVTDFLNLVEVFGKACL